MRGEGKGGCGIYVRYIHIYIYIYIYISWVLSGMYVVDHVFIQQRSVLCP